MRQGQEKSPEGWQKKEGLGRRTMEAEAWEGLTIGRGFA